MAIYTIELRDVVSNHNIFDFAYEFYDESKRTKFETDFIRHFYFREIGVETVDRFIFNLCEKMNTVFPYYNELFKAANIKYSVLDNYALNEIITRTQENTGKTAGVSSTVGQVFDNQTTETTENGTTNTTTTGNGSETSETNHTGNSETVGTDKSDSTNNSTVSTTGTKTGETSETKTENAVKKFLDTPQGLTDLTNSKYLTTLNQDTLNGSTSGNSSESSETQQTTTGTAGATSEKESTTETTDTTTGTATRNNSESSETENSSTGSVNQTGEQRTTADNNTRTTHTGKISETVETKRTGNIGVDSDADMIQKHIKLQQILKNVQKMFFDECEDLFMQIY